MIAVLIIAFLVWVKTTLRMDTFGDGGSCKVMLQGWPLAVQRTNWERQPLYLLTPALMGDPFPSGVSVPYRNNPAITLVN